MIEYFQHFVLSDQECVQYYFDQVQGLLLFLYMDGIKIHEFLIAYKYSEQCLPT